MRLTIALLVLVNVYFSNAKSLPAVIENPCKQDELYKLQFYFPYPDDETRFIECNPWGEMTIKECPQGSKWNQWLSSCIIPVPQQEMPIEDKMNTTITSTPFCSYYGNFTCKNGGICNQFLTESKCFCLQNFTGDYCEVSATSSGAFGQLINSTFSLDLYKKQRPLENDTLTFNTTFDTSMVLDDITKKRVQQYLDSYPNGEMRFDTLINYLIQDILSQLYPNSFFLREFLLQSEMDMGYSNAIPNLLQSAKYAYDRFDNFFLIFEEVLDRLVDYLPIHMPKIKDEAQNFFEVYDMIFTKLSKVNNVTTGETVENRTDLTRDEMKESIYEGFNTTLQYAYDLFRYLNVFDDELSMRGQNLTTEEIRYVIGNFSVDQETTRILAEIHLTSTETWDSLSFYGFWYVISSYVTVPEDDVKPIAGALVGDEGDEGDDTVTGTDDGFVPLVDSFKSETTVLPKVGALSRDSTTAIPKVNALLSESTTVLPKVGAQLGESTTVVPETGALLSESTTVMPKVGALLSESTTVLPKVDAQLGESTKIPFTLLETATLVPPHVGALVSDKKLLEDSLRASISKALIADDTILLKPNVEITESTTVVPSVGAQFGESTTTIPRAGF